VDFGEALAAVEFAEWLRSFNVTECSRCQCRGPGLGLSVIGNAPGLGLLFVWVPPGDLGLFADRLVQRGITEARAAVLCKYCWVRAEGAVRGECRANPGASPAGVSGDG
jgi:hypothetical protein